MPVFQLTHDLAFPPVRLARSDGLLAIGGDLTPQRLLLAYRHGIFPWFGHDDPILWWAPDPRLLLFPAEFHTPRRLRRTIRSGRFAATVDTAFRDVIEACAQTRGPRRESTWITPGMLEAYCALHRAGFAHSIEVWSGPDLAGGLYGVSLGACFFGESMFHHVTDASKVALAVLVQVARDRGIHFIDCQMPTPHLLGLGAREVPRPRFQRLLARALAVPAPPGRWQNGA